MNQLLRYVKTASILDGLKLVPLEDGRSLSWDVRVVCFAADSVVETAGFRDQCVGHVFHTRFWSVNFASERRGELV